MPKFGIVSECICLDAGEVTPPDKAGWQRPRLREELIGAVNIFNAGPNRVVV